MKNRFTKSELNTLTYAYMGLFLSIGGIIVGVILLL